MSGCFLSRLRLLITRALEAAIRSIELTRYVEDKTLDSCCVSHVPADSREVALIPLTPALSTGAS
jgi:hypothetical protein